MTLQEFLCYLTCLTYHHPPGGSSETMTNLSLWLWHLEYDLKLAPPKNKKRYYLMTVRSSSVM
jgi:hypothetical protein